ncbi:MAG: NAD(P)H-hydrate dehydratase [Chloroflexi bacterium]|nr:NAD(P)H-hydrate dehydratase [Chloroflexota bacterium]
MKLVTVGQMHAIEKEADAKGVSYAEMMQNAGRGLAELVHALGQENGWDEVVGLVGSGNNGGDTLVALAWLAEAGWRTHAYLVNRKKNDELIAHYLSVGGEVSESTNDENDESLTAFLNQSHVFVDGMLGTGIKLPLKKEAAQLLGKINFITSEMELPPFIVAVDCPSGVDCDTGEAADETIPADLTITMAAVKHGLLKLPAFEFVGELQVVDIGLPEKLNSWNSIFADVADWNMVSALMPERTPASHKGTFGTVFVVAGSASYTGAALLAGKAAYRIGAGLVTLAVPEPLHAALAGHIPEATWVLLPHENGFISDHASDNVLQNLQVLPSPSSAAWTVLQNLERATAFLIGPGLGDKLSTGAFVEDLIPSVQIPMVVDADGLRHLSQITDWYKKLFAPAVLTPHPGEMSVLTGLPKAEIQSNREAIAGRYSKEWEHVVVLKGAFTVVASPDGRSTIIPVATPALARAGTGDVLAGLIVGLRAQGLDAYDAAVAGAFIHAQAGLFAAETLGTTASVLASDVLDAVSNVISELE